MQKNIIICGSVIVNLFFILFYSCMVYYGSKLNGTHKTAMVTGFLISLIHAIIIMPIWLALCLVKNKCSNISRSKEYVYWMTSILYIIILFAVIFSGFFVDGELGTGLLIGGFSALLHFVVLIGIVLAICVGNEDSNEVELLYHDSDT